MTLSVHGCLLPTSDIVGKIGIVNARGHDVGAVVFFVTINLAERVSHSEPLNCNHLQKERLEQLFQRGSL